MQSAVLLIGWFLARWWPSLVLDLAEIKSVLSVVGYTMGFGIFNYMFENADKVMVGSVLGASALGVYSIGQRVLMYPVYSMTLNDRAGAVSRRSLGWATTTERSAVVFCVRVRRSLS